MKEYKSSVYGLIKEPENIMELFGLLIGSSDEEFLTIKVKIFTEGAKGGVGGPMGQSGEIGTRGSGGGGAGSYNGSTSLFGSRGGHGFVEIVW